MLVANVPRREIEGIYEHPTKIGKPKMTAEEYSAWEKYIQEEYDTEKKKGANARQIGGSHYKDRGVQPWDVVDDCFSHAEAMGFYKGNALKYIMRAGSKGPAREDYEKAIHYLEKLLEVL